jgi:carbonic anhydrase
MKIRSLPPKPFMSHQTSRSSSPSLWASVAIIATILLGNLPPAGSAETNAAPTAAAPVASSLTGEQALQRLIEGNARFVAGQAIHPDQSNERRVALAGGQAPFAIVLTCSDSRVAPELFFDQGLGDLFVIRNAGNVLDDHVIGSMEYAVEHLHVPLIIVVGHEKCGAVTAAVAGGAVPGHLHSVTDDLAPAVEQAKSLPGDLVDNAVRANAERAAEVLTHVEPVLKEAAGRTNLLIVAAYYNLDTGKIEILK